MTAIRKVALVGAGNVATHMGRGFISRGIQVKTVFSQTDEHASALAQRLGARPTTSLAAVTQGDPDLVLIAVKDDAIEEVARAVPRGRWVVAHTSGVTSLRLLSAHHQHAGIFYPLQTLTADREANLREVPFCLEATDNETGDRLLQLAQEISDKANFYTEEQRQWLHLAAVFSCNFVNFLYGVADDLLEREGLDLDLLQPLLLETARRVNGRHPHDIQTGPAVRQDRKTLGKHEEMLTDRPNYLELYRQLTQRINDARQRKL